MPSWLSPQWLCGIFTHLASVRFEHSCHGSHGSLMTTYMYIYTIYIHIYIYYITYQNWYKTIQHDGDLLSTRKNNFNVHKMVANNKKTSNIVFFLHKLSLGVHTIHSLSFCLRTLLILVYNKIVLAKRVLFLKKLKI